jgi:acetoin utilization deacetylase AcuC-like enzyme
MAKTGYLFDSIFLEHETGAFHPECPERLRAINDKLKKAGFYRDLVKISPKKPDMKYIEMVHTREYIQAMKEDIQCGKPAVDYGDTAVCTRSYDVAIMAVGGCLRVCDSVMKGDVTCAFCAVRPPGHHAERRSAAGFCIFNNIAIMTKYLQARHGLDRIAIVDWDVHHGNGTQHTFESDDSVLYISLHQYPHYPGSGSSMERGRGMGQGFTMNFPMPAGSGDKEYIALFDDGICPAIEKFDPQIILVSAGFDAHRADHLSSIKLSTEAYAEFTKRLMETAGKCCGGKIIAVLEGGYNLDALANSVAAVIRTFVEG